MSRRHTLNQLKGQVYHASLALDREAKRIAEERNIPLTDAYAAVFADPVLLKKCHDAAPSMGTLASWIDPNNQPR